MNPILSLHIHHLSNPPLLTPHSLSAATTTATDGGLQFRSKILYLESLNINSLKAVTLNPTLRSSPLHSVIAVEETLTTAFGLQRSSLGRILDMFPQLLTASPDATLLPVSRFLLDDVVLPFSHLSRAVVRCPRLLVSDVSSQLRPTLLFLRNHLRFRNINSHTTVLLVSSVDGTLIPKLDFLRNLGFEEGEVVTMVQRSPALLTYSIDNNLTPKIEYFLGEMKGDLSEIRRFPQYFSFSLDGRIKPRHMLLEEHGFSMSLQDMLKVSDGEFNVRLLEMRLRLTDRYQSCKL